MTRIYEVLEGDGTWGEYSLDVLGHAGLGAAWSVIPIALGVFFGGWGFGLAMAVGMPLAVIGGAIREWLQYRKSGKAHTLDRVLDVLHHILGPPIALGLVQAVMVWV